MPASNGPQFLRSGGPQAVTRPVLILREAPHAVVPSSGANQPRCHRHRKQTSVFNAHFRISNLNITRVTRSVRFSSILVMQLPSVMTENIVRGRFRPNFPSLADFPAMREGAVSRRSVLVHKGALEAGTDRVLSCHVCPQFTAILWVGARRGGIVQVDPSKTTREG